MKKFSVLALLTLVLTTTACTQQPPVPPLNLNADVVDLSARFITERHHGDDEHDDHADDINNEWLFWRSAQRIEVSIPRQQTGEAWLKDGHTFFYQKLFHADHKMVEYQREDLSALNVDVDWRTNQLMIDPRVLAQLKVTDERWIDGHPALELEGTIDRIEYEVVWLVDLNIPWQLTKQDDAGNREHTRLQEVHTDAAAALVAPNSSDYEAIDYADLGDRERDPFVLKIQNHLVGGHVHTH